VALSGNVTVPGSASITSAGNITQSGGALAAGTLSLSSIGSVTQAGGSLTATVLNANAGGPITLGTAGTANIAGTGTVTSLSAIRLVDSGPLQLGGALSAPELAITATGQLILAGGTITTDGLPLSQQTLPAASLPGSFLQVLPAANGTAVLTQTGTTTVLPLSGTTATLRLDLPSSGALTLNGLNAPSTNLVLALGTGKATGTLNALNLTVLGAGGSATLFGEVGGRVGTVAAQVSKISPEVSEIYTLNGCAIMAVSCAPARSFLTSVLTIGSILRPDEVVLNVLDLAVTHDRDDPTLLLPNISNRDY
jgi:filamentous hemagglutinin